MKLTPEQDQAIRTRGVSIGLSSGAGCGKTFVLTQRLLGHLLDGGHLHELAAITFTERAAREMRDRVRTAIQDRLDSSLTDADRRRWLAHSRELDSARISTIHAFCGSFLRANAVEAGLDPNFATLDQAQAESLLASVIDDELRRILADRNEDAINLIIDYALRDVIGMIRALLEKRADLDLDAWADCSVDKVLDRWEQYFREEYLPAQMQTFLESELVQHTQELLTRHRSSNRNMEEMRTNVLRLLPDLPRTTKLAATLEELNANCRVQGGGGAKAWDTPEVYENVKNAFTKLRNEIKDLLAAINFNRSAARSAAENGLRVLRVTRPILAEYTRRKIELAALDFDDLLIRTRDLLRDPRNAALRKRTAAGLKLLLVDELQDTDPLQVELVQALCDGDILGGRVFVVGDYKQSIYRFRGADPRVFQRLLDSLPQAGRLSLTTSFRSQPGILDFVNATFLGVFAESYEPLAGHRARGIAGASVEYLWRGQQKDERAVQYRRSEADLIAKRIREMLDGEERIIVDHAAEKAGQTVLRPVREEDIAILFRALSDVKEYETALREAGIKYYLVGGHAFYAQQEIFDILNVLRALANPDDLVSAIGALRSPMFSLTDETFYWLAKSAGGLQAAARTGLPLPPQLDADQRRQVEYAAETLSQLRALKDRVTISVLLAEVFRRTGYDAALLAEFLGERKLANVRKLVNQARAFQSADGFTLDEFIARLAEFVSSQPREALAAIHPEAAGVVRLMTIHQAKGLEFPVVFVPDVDRKPHSSSPVARFDSRLGPLVKPSRDEKKTTTGLAMIRQEEDAEDKAESARLFYVACTRAADYLVLAGSISDFEKPAGSWTRILAETCDLQTGRFLRELPEEWTAPSIRVNVVEPEDEEEEFRRIRERKVSLRKLVADARENLFDPFVSVPRSVSPVPADVAGRREFSFSRLTGALRENVPEPDDSVGPTSEQQAGRGHALALGTLVHRALESNALQPRDLTNAAALKSRLQAITAKQPKITPAQLAEAEGMLANLAAMPLAGRLAAASVVEREIDFVLAWPFDDTASTTPAAQFLQGVIDVLYQDGSGQWHVLDYKTNHVTVAGVAQAAAAYELQMFVYFEAVTRILGGEPASVSLAFLRAGAEHAFHFSPADRKRLTLMLHQAVAAANQSQAERSLRDEQGNQRGTPARTTSASTNAEPASPPPPFTLRAESRRRVTRKR